VAKDQLRHLGENMKSAVISMSHAMANGLAADTAALNNIMVSHCKTGPRTPTDSFPDIHILQALVTCAEDLPLLHCCPRSWAACRPPLCRPIPPSPREWHALHLPHVGLFAVLYNVQMYMVYGCLLQHHTKQFLG